MRGTPANTRVRGGGPAGAGAAIPSARGGVVPGPVGIPKGTAARGEPMAERVFPSVSPPPSPKLQSYIRYVILIYNMIMNLLY